MMAPASPVAGQKFCSVARLGGYYDLKYYRHCDYLIGDTEAIVAYLIEQGWPEDRAVYLPNFVDDRKAEALPRSVLAVPEGTRLLLGLGRLHRNKGFDVLLEALSLLPDCVLLLAGTGPEEEALKAHAAALGIAERVRFLGWREDVAALMASVDLFVHPARHEPLGNVILEAWAHQRVVIACESDGPRRLIEDGVTGLLAPIDEPGRLAEIINEALSEPGDCASMAAAGAQFYAEHFAKPAVVRQYADFFARILG